MTSFVQGYRGCAIGKGRQLAKTEIEKLALDELTAEEALVEAARMYVPLAHAFVALRSRAAAAGVPECGRQM
jgi:hypothetical protein